MLFKVFHIHTCFRIYFRELCHHPETFCYFISYAWHIVLLQRNRRNLGMLCMAIIPVSEGEEWRWGVPSHHGWKPKASLGYRTASKRGRGGHSNCGAWSMVGFKQSLVSFTLPYGFLVIFITTVCWVLATVIPHESTGSFSTYQFQWLWPLQYQLTLLDICELQVFFFQHLAT